MIGLGSTRSKGNGQREWLSGTTICIIWCDLVWQSAKEFSGPPFLTPKCQRFPNKKVVLSSLSVFCFLADSPLIYQQSIPKVFSLSSCRPLPIISSLPRNLGHVLHPNWMCGVLPGDIKWTEKYFFKKKHGYWNIKMLQYHERKKPGPRANI